MADNFMRWRTKGILLLVLMMALSACGSTGTTPVPVTQPSIPSNTPQPPTIPAGTDVPTQVATPTAAGSQGNVTVLPDPNAYKWVPVASGFQLPTDIQFPDDGSGRMFVLEQPGRIRIVKGGQVLDPPFLDINEKVGSAGSEQGLLGLAFHPDYKNNPYFYVNYTDTQGNTVIARYQANGDEADPNSEKILIHQDQPFPNHNGGVLVFGPDGYLYAGLGDGGSQGDPFGNGQNTSVLLGKILRIDVDHGNPYAIPAGNPFGNEIWEYGLRNPWRISFDKANGDLYIADVGQNTWEEVDYVSKGQGGLNFGWNYREASHPYQGTVPPNLQLTEPVAEYSHVSSRCSITGGYVYRGSMPEWQGIYLYADYCSGETWGMLRTADPSSQTGWVSQILYSTGGNITTFGQDPGGEIYYADREGTVYELQK
jgi:glucose/arabinose dehydrogenase